MTDYDFKIGDMLLDDKNKSGLTLIGLITDTWDDYEHSKMIRIKWIRKDDGSEYNWDYGIGYLMVKIKQYNMTYYPVKE
jgi:hypothetical protein